jgi:cbb3-type cytochrome oxidase subunit 3
MTSRLINLFECALCVALLYGINLYFSITGNISNPVVPMWWPATKDAFFLLLFCLFLIGLRVHHPRWSLPLTLVIVFSATCAALSISSFGFSKESLSFTKNILLYFAGGAIIGTLIAGVCSPPEMALRVSRVVFISVLVGFACLLLPAQSTDGRLYGTYGNPTSFGYAVFLAFALSVAFRPASESIMFALLLGLVYVVTGSISVLLAAGVFIIVFSMLEISKKRAVGLQIVHLIVIALSVGIFGKLLHDLNWPAFGYERLVDIFNSDSVAIRMKAFALMIEGNYQRYDSFFLGLYKNFGWAPLLVYFGLLASLAAAYGSSFKTTPRNAVVAAICCIFILNPLLQHQIEIFPTNFLFGLFLGYVIHWFSQDKPLSITK